MRVLRRRYVLWLAFGLITIGSAAFISMREVTTIYLIGDSTMADYSTYEGEDYMNKRYPLMGWGQVFQELFDESSLGSLSHLIQSDSVLVDDAPVEAVARGLSSKKEDGR